jgi:hypothetical protein
MIGARQDQYARRENFVVLESVSEERFTAALSLLCRRRIEESDVARESEAESGSNIAAQPRVLLPSLRTG